MQFTSTITAIILGAAAIASAAPGAGPSPELETRTNTYEGSSRMLFARHGLEARCHGGQLIVGSQCDPGKCECSGNAGCYSCNGGPPVCQATDGSGNPTTCLQ